MRTLLLLAFLLLPAWGQIDPLRPAEEPTLGFRVGLGYGPFGGRGIGVDEGGPYAFTRAGHDLRLEVGLSWRATQEVSLEGAVGLSLLLLGEERVREGRREASWWGEGGWGLQVGAAYRLRELPGRPRVYLGARYPWGLEGGVSLAFLRDPVVATLGGSLDWSPGEPPSWGWAWGWAWWPTRCGAWGLGPPCGCPWEWSLLGEPSSCGRGTAWTRRGRGRWRCGVALGTGASGCGWSGRGGYRHESHLSRTKLAPQGQSLRGLCDLRGVKVHKGGRRRGRERPTSGVHKG